MEPFDTQPGHAFKTVSNRITQGAFVVPYAVAGAIVALLLAMFSISMRNEARITALETVAQSPTKLDAQFAVVNTRLTDFIEMYERDRVNDRVSAARQAP